MGEPINTDNLKLITSHFIYKDGAYWLTCNVYSEMADDVQVGIDIIPKEWGFNNGFDSPATAFSYLASLQGEPEYNPKEEEKLKEMGEV